MRIGYHFALLVLCTAQCLDAQPHPHSGYRVLRRTQDIAFDGIITSPSEWSDADLCCNSQEGQWIESTGQKRDRQSTFRNTFKLIWDDGRDGGIYLYGALNHQAPAVTASGPVEFLGLLDSANIFFDPNLDGESSFNPNSGSRVGPDGYQFAFNVSGPSPDGTPGYQYIDGGTQVTGNVPFYLDAHVNTRWGTNGTNPSYAGNGVDLSGSGLTLATHGDASHWSFELFIPFSMFDACSGGIDGRGEGLCLTGEDSGAPINGDEWLFSYGVIFNAPDDGPGGVAPERTHYPLYSAFIGDGVESFASWPHPSIRFFDTFSVQYDKNGDSAVDAADAALLFTAWGTGEAICDLNNDDFVDGADAGLLFSAWTGDPTPAKPGGATAKYNPATGTLSMNINGAVNAFVESAGGGLTPSSHDPVPEGGLLSANAFRIGLTGIQGITVNNWTAEIGEGLPMDDLLLKFIPALGRAEVLVRPGEQSFYPWPEPHSSSLLLFGLPGFLATRRRLG